MVLLTPGLAFTSSCPPCREGRSAIRGNFLDKAVYFFERASGIQSRLIGSYGGRVLDREVLRHDLQRWDAWYTTNRTSSFNTARVAPKLNRINHDRSGVGLLPNNPYLDSSHHSLLILSSSSLAVRSGACDHAIEFDCSRIFGLVMELFVLRAMMESARGEPIDPNDLIGATVVIGFPSRRSEPVRHHVEVSRNSRRLGGVIPPLS